MFAQTSLAAAASRMALLSYPSIAQQGCALGNGLNQGLDFTGIMNLPAGQPQADRASFSIDKSVEFTGEAAPGTSHATIAAPPFLPVAPFWWTRMQVESIICLVPASGGSG
jgi:hypothetical protein